MRQLRGFDRGWRRGQAAAMRCAGSRTLIRPLSAARLTAESTARSVAVTMLPCIPAPYRVWSQPAVHACGEIDQRLTVARFGQLAGLQRLHRFELPPNHSNGPFRSFDVQIAPNDLN